MGGRRTMALLDRPKRTGTRKHVAIREQMPLVDDLESVQSYVMTQHAIERCEERGIGVLEVYSTLAEPTNTGTQLARGGQTFIRGDVKVVANPVTREIVTVMDLNEEERTSPREPLHPNVARRKATLMPRAKASTAQSLDEAWCLLPHKSPETRLIIVTPALAQKLLELNTGNRPMRPNHVAEIARAIKEGEFKLTHQGIALDTKPRLQDGQHRLAAVMHTEIATPMWVSVGQDPANFDIIDVGRPRTYGDVLALEGETNVFVLGATVRLVYQYQHGTASEMRAGKISNHQMNEEFQRDPEGFRNAVRVGNIVGQHVDLTKTAAAAGYYLIARVNRTKDVDEWFDGLISGENISGARVVLTRMLRRLKDEGKRANATHHLAVLLKAWNADLTRAERAVIGWRKGEDMPRVARQER